jgi:hypothetical protein
MTTIAEDAGVLRQLRDGFDAADSRAKSAKQVYEDAQRKFFERLEAEGIGSIKVDGVNFVPQTTIYGQVQDREAFLAWAETADEALVETRERKALINELVREAIENGDPLPPGLGFYQKDYVSQRVAT